MKFTRLFTEHPASVNETYLEHAGVAGHFAKELALASMAAAVHAVVPGLCCTSASDRIKCLYAEMTTGHRAEDCDEEPLAAPSAIGVAASTPTAASR